MKKIALITVLIFFSSFVGAWWDSDWDNRKPIEVNENSGNSLSNYQILVSINTETLINDNKLQPDCSDIRFVDNEDSELNHYIEQGCDSTSTKIWVKIPNIEQSASETVYMYYNNPEANSVSNPEAVFDFYDSADDYSTWSDDTDGSMGYTYKNLDFQIDNNNDYAITAVFEDLGSGYGEWTYHAQNYLELRYEGMETRDGVNIGQGYGGGGGSDGIRTSAESPGDSGEPPENTLLTYNIYNQGEEYDYDVRWFEDREIWYNAGETSTSTESYDQISYLVRDDWNYRGDGSETFGDCLRFRSTSHSDNNVHECIYDIYIRKYADPEPTTNIGQEQESNNPPEVVNTWLEKEGIEFEAGDDGVPLEPNLIVDVEDEHYTSEKDLSVTFYEGDIGAGELGIVEAGNTEDAVFEGDEHNLGEDTGTSYEWSVEVEDPEGEKDTAGPWSFTTVHEPEVVGVSASPQGGETASTSPSFSVDVSHEDGEEMDVYFFLEGEGFVGEDRVDGGGGASVNYEGLLDADGSYDWYVEVEDDEFQVSNEDSPWSFETDSGEVDIKVLEDSDAVNLNPFSRGILNVEPRHSNAEAVSYLRLVDSEGRTVEAVEDVAVDEPISLLWPSEDLEPNKQYEWKAEAEHSGEVAQTDTASFTTIAVEVALSSRVSNAEGYNIYRREDSEISDPEFDYGNADYEDVGIVDELDNVIRDVSEGLETGKTYCYVATAYNVGGEGPGSDEVCMEGEVQLE